MKIYSREEVLRHNKIGDCWVVINNNVYDLSDFIKKHPGGSDIIESRAGEDATSFFAGKHGKNPRVIERLASFRIGEITESERVLTNDFNDDFMSELVDRCYMEKLYQALPWYSNIWFYARALNIIIFFACSLTVLYAPVHWMTAILLVIIQGIVSTSLFGLLAHEATHRNFPKNRLMKGLLTFSWPIFWPFIIKTPLRYEHNSHHVKIGDPEHDYEVAGFALFMRYSGLVKHNFLHKYQHKLAGVLYLFYANIITTIGGIKSGFWEKHNRTDHTEQKFSLAATFLYFVLIPAIVNQSALWYVLLYLVYQCTLYFGIYVGAAINHFVPAVAKKIPVEHVNKFGYYVCHNTTNFCSSSPFWLWYTGGFNIQIEHHLIPFIPIENLTRMVPIVKELCDKYGYPYKDYLTIKELWDDHYAYLRMMSENAQSEGVLTEIMNKQSYQAR